MTTVKSSNRVKITTPFKYRHYWLAASVDNHPFPYELFGMVPATPEQFDIPALCPNREVDSNLLSRGNSAVVTGYSSRKTAQSFEYQGWRFLAITSDQVHHLPQGDVMGSLWDVFKGITVEGEKWSLKYAHYAIAVPRNKYAEFPLDMLRYDRAFIFNKDDADLIELRSSHRGMDDAAIARYAARRGFDGICVSTFTESASEKAWTPERWHSFGWVLKEPVASFWRS
jgi:hypothetical protein